MQRDLLRRAVEHHQAGRLATAERQYRQVLATVPDDADALHLLGVLAHQRGRWAEAVARIARAVRLRPDAPHFHANLGHALAAAGRLPEAEAALREACRLQPDDPDAHYNLGHVLAALGRPEAAARCFGAAIARRPDFAEAHNNLGTALRDLGRLGEAETCLREALRLQPGSAAAHANLGNVLAGQGRPAAAETCLREALRLRPGWPEALNSLGSVLASLARPGAAEACYREALSVRPDLSDAHNNLGSLLCDIGRFEAAQACIAEAIRLNPGDADAHINLGRVLTALGRPEQAARCCREALRLRPGDADAEYGLGVALLLSGELAAGWAGYERRWQRRGFAPRRLPGQLWDGEPTGERVLLIHAEQGLGDTLQFCRYVPPIAARARVILEVPRPLLRLMRGLAGVEQVVARGEALPRYDLQFPLTSLPGLAGTTLDTIPRDFPYLRVVAGEAERWRRRFAGLAGLRVGLVWAGNPLYAADARRSLPPERLGVLAGVAGVDFLSLQMPPGPGVPGMLLHDPSDALHDMADTAALIETLDLVIGVDTAVIHLAGALGRPVWLLNRFDTCWRWLLGRSDSPWYPSLRQFRQPSPGDWDSVLAAVRAALEQAVRR